MARFRTVVRDGRTREDFEYWWDTRDEAERYAREEYEARKPKRFTQLCDADATGFEGGVSYHEFRHRDWTLRVEVHEVA